MTEPTKLPNWNPDDVVVEALIERCDMTEEEARKHVVRLQGWEITPSLPPQPLAPLVWRSV